MKGELALSFGGLLRKLWAPGSTSVAPRRFKLKLSNFSPQVDGYNQHDSQKFLVFLLDGLHEDLDRVKCKPYIETKDAEGRPHEEVAEEYWQNRLDRNDSIVVDLCQGQYRSTLVCPSSCRPSVTFDPFMYLSLPLPYPTMRSMTMVVFCTDVTAKPSTFTILVLKLGILKNLIDALSNAGSLRDGETFLVTEIYWNDIFCFLVDPSDSLEFFRDEDMLVAYRVLKENDTGPLIVFIHQQLEIHHSYGSTSSTRASFGIPLVARMSNIVKGCDIHKELLKVLNPFLLSFDAYAKCGELDKAYMLYNHALEKGFDLGIDSASILVNVVTNGGKHHETDTIIRKNVEAGLALDTIAFHTYIEAMLEEEKLQFATSIYGLMIGTGVAPSSQTYNIMMNIYAAAGLHQEAHIFLTSMATKADSFIYLSLIRAYIESWKFKEAEDIINSMKINNIPLTCAYFNFLFSALGKGGMIKEAVRVYEYLRISSGINPNLICTRKMLRDSPKFLSLRTRIC